MTSSDFGKVSCGRSNFSQTCSLLSQYLKEKGSFGDLSLSLTPNFTETKEAMNLLPKIEQPNQKEATLPQLVRGEDIPNIGVKDIEQMTIFYAGQVVVFNDFPADKANEIMILARKCGTSKIPHSAAFAPPHKAQKPAKPATITPNIIPTSSPLPALDSDLPIARKNSLARFLEKRKDRITANAPYQASKPDPKPVKTEPWLELGSQFPFQIQRH